MLIGGILGASILPAFSDKLRKRKAFLVICAAGVVPGMFALTFAGNLSADPATVYSISLTASFGLGFFMMSSGPVGFQYAAEVCHPAPESSSQGMLLWVGQVTGLLFVSGMSTQSNRYLPTFMIGFAILPLFSLGAALFLRESPMIITEPSLVTTCSMVQLVMPQNGQMISAGFIIQPTRVRVPGDADRSCYENAVYVRSAPGRTGAPPGKPDRR